MSERAHLSLCGQVRCTPSLLLLETGRKREFDGSSTRNAAKLDDSCCVNYDQTTTVTSLKEQISLLSGPVTLYQTASHTNAVIQLFPREFFLFVWFALIFKVTFFCSSSNNWLTVSKTDVQSLWECEEKWRWTQIPTCICIIILCLSIICYPNIWVLKIDICSKKTCV